MRLTATTTATPAGRWKPEVLECVYEEESGPGLAGAAAAAAAANMK